MTADSAYRDRLISDPKPGKEDKPRFLSRKESEAQLEDTASALDGGTVFTAALQSIDEDGYLELTRNFRNLASHAIAPCLTVGHANMVVRRVVPATMLVQQPDGSCKDESVPGKQQVSYGLDGTEPLQMRAVFAANLAEFQKASTCFDAYVVLNKALATLPRR
jgi:hypothetical protein